MPSVVTKGDRSSRAISSPLISPMMAASPRPAMSGTTIGRIRDAGQRRVRDAAHDDHGADRNQRAHGSDRQVDAAGDDDDRHAQRHQRDVAEVAGDVQKVAGRGEVAGERGGQSADDDEGQRHIGGLSGEEAAAMPGDPADIGEVGRPAASARLDRAGDQAGDFLGAGAATGLSATFGPVAARRCGRTR